MNIRLIVFILFIGALVIGIYFANKAKHDDYQSSEINGTIDTLWEYKGTVTFYVNGTQFDIIPSIGVLNDNTPFNEIAQKNDSVFKPVNTDVLKLIHKGRTYLYKAY